MKKICASTLAAVAIVSGLTHAQDAAPPQNIPHAPETVAKAQPPLPAPAAPGKPGAGTSGLPELRSEGGYYVENAPINEVFQYLTRLVGRQYFFNNEVSDPKYNVSGNLVLTDPQKQMEELAVAFGLSVYQQGSTTYLMNEEQLARLPVEVMSYQLKYLRGSKPANPVVAIKGQSAEGSPGAPEADFEKIKNIIKPMLSHGVGLIEFEEKTNTLLITDNTVKLKQVRSLLEEIDKPKRQIAINVRILRVRKNNGRKVGVDWSKALGDGLPISLTQSLNAAFRLPDSSTLVKSAESISNSASSFSSAVDAVTNNSFTGSSRTSDGTTSTTSNSTRTGAESFNQSSTSQSTYTEGSGMTFAPLQVQAIIHALEEHNLITQEACPTVITEDNEQGLITIVDRFPIVLSQITNTNSGTNITDQVRYKVDDEDPDPMREPQLSREIGVTLSVTPTLLPDGTVRMRLRPRVANVTEFITGKSGNIFPRVNESTVEGISRVPAGQSLFLGGFYDSSDARDNKHVPFLGSIPVIKNLFSYKNDTGEQVSLVFIITPNVYDAVDARELPALNQNVQWNSGYNRTGPWGPVTPLLPDIEPRPPGYLPQPADRDSQPPLPGYEPTPGPPKRTWLGRLFAKRPPQEKPSPPPASAAPSKRETSTARKMLIR